MKIKKIIISLVILIAFAPLNFASAASAITLGKETYDTTNGVLNDKKFIEKYVTNQTDSTTVGSSDKTATNLVTLKAEIAELLKSEKKKVSTEQNLDTIAQFETVLKEISPYTTVSIPDKSQPTNKPTVQLIDSRKSLLNNVDIMTTGVNAYDSIYDQIITNKDPTIALTLEKRAEELKVLFKKNTDGTVDSKNPSQEQKDIQATIVKASLNTNTIKELISKDEITRGAMKMYDVDLYKIFKEKPTSVIAQACDYSTFDQTNKDHIVERTGLPIPVLESLSKNTAACKDWVTSNADVRKVSEAITRNQEFLSKYNEQTNYTINVGLIPGFNGDIYAFFNKVIRSSVSIAMTLAVFALVLAGFSAVQAKDSAKEEYFKKVTSVATGIAIILFSYLIVAGVYSLFYSL